MYFQRAPLASTVNECDRVYVLEWSYRNQNVDAMLAGDVTEVDWITWISPRVQFYELTELDWDQDGQMDNTDDDWDNDGVLNVSDDYPFDATQSVDPDATDGSDGADGTDGTDGSGGADGTDGTDGSDGSDGSDDTDQMVPCSTATRLMIPPLIVNSMHKRLVR